MGWFKHWFGTRYYALLYGHRDEGDAELWVDAIMGQWNPSSCDRILDLACGRGRHARYFSEKGLKVTGVDISETSISEARVSVPDGTFHVHDMREPFAHEEFDLACCLFTSLGYFEALDDDRAVFRAVFQALRPGGRFVLDFMNSDLVVRDLVATEDLERSGVQFRIDRVCEDGILVKRIRVKDGAEVHEFEERVQTLAPFELESMATEAGFIIEDRTNGPVLTPFDPERSDRFVLWMRKPMQ